MKSRKNYLIRPNLSVPTLLSILGVSIIYALYEKNSINISTAATIILATAAIVTLYLQTRFSSSVYVYVKPPKEGDERLEICLINQGRKQVYIHLTNFVCPLSSAATTIQPIPSKLPQPFLVSADSIEIKNLPIGRILEPQAFPLAVSLVAIVILAGSAPVAKKITLKIFEL